MKRKRGRPKGSKDKKPRTIKRKVGWPKGKKRRPELVLRQFIKPGDIKPLGTWEKNYTPNPNHLSQHELDTLLNNKEFQGYIHEINHARISEDKRADLIMYYQVACIDAARREEFRIKDRNNKSIWSILVGD